MWETHRELSPIHGFTVPWPADISDHLILFHLLFLINSPLDVGLIQKRCFCKNLRTLSCQATCQNLPTSSFTETKHFEVLSGFPCLQSSFIFLVSLSFLVSPPSLLSLSPSYSFSPVSSTPLPLCLLLHLCGHFTTLNYLPLPSVSVSDAKPSNKWGKTDLVNESIKNEDF